MFHNEKKQNKISKKQVVNRVQFLSNQLLWKNESKAQTKSRKSSLLMSTFWILTCEWEKWYDIFMWWSEAKRKCVKSQRNEREWSNWRRFYVFSSKWIWEQMILTEDAFLLWKTSLVGTSVCAFAGGQFTADKLCSCGKLTIFYSISSWAKNSDRNGRTVFLFKIILTECNF